MAALIALAVAAAVAPRLELAGADPLTRWTALIREAAARAHIPEAWIRRVMRAESGGRTMLGGRPITSTAGAMGLMQLMPATWGAMRARLDLGSDPFDPHDNILAGAVFLRLMYDRFGYPGLFGAYNAGPARYAAHLKGAALPAETIGYLAKVSGDEGAAAAPDVAERPALFVTIHNSGSAGVQQRERADLLFAVRHAVFAGSDGTPPAEGGE